MSELRKLSIFDTTLRDGEQAPGNAMTVDQKLLMATELEELGVNLIEAGFPAASKEDFEAVRAVSKALKRAKVCAFARATREDIDAVCAALRDGPPFQIEILSAVSDIHLQHKRCISREEALAEAKKAVEYAVALGLEDVSVAPEDATRADPDFLRRMVDTVVEAGATTIGVPDTVGAFLPHQFRQIILDVRSWVGEEIRISVHAHNDLGLAVAGTLAGIEAGADECQVTLCGIGERAGNAALEEVIAALVSHEEWYRRSTSIRTERISSSCQKLIGVLGLATAKAKPIIGANAFATAAGIHQSGILREPRTYEFLDPAMFGRKREILLSRHSGRAALRKRLEVLGFNLTELQVLRVYDALNASSIRAWSDDVIMNTAGGVLAEVA